jgi:hypothetical protein
MCLLLHFLLGNVKFAGVILQHLFGTPVDALPSLTKRTLAAMQALGRRKI